MKIKKHPVSGVSGVNFFCFGGGHSGSVKGDCIKRRIIYIMYSLVY